MGEVHGIALSLVGCEEIELFPESIIAFVTRVAHVPLVACKLGSFAPCTVLYFAPFKARSSKNVFRLLLETESAIIRPVSRKEFLGTLVL